MAEGVSTGQQRGDADGGQPEDPAAPLLVRARVMLSIAIAYTVRAIVVAGQWVAATSARAAHATARAAHATARATARAAARLRATAAEAVGGARASLAARRAEARRRATEARLRRWAARRASEDGGAPAAERTAAGLGLSATVATGQPATPIPAAPARPPVPTAAIVPAGPRAVVRRPTATQRFAARARFLMLRFLYNTGVGTLRLLGIIGLVILLAVMATSLALPAVLPGAKFVKANLVRFSSYPPLPDEFAAPAERSTILASDGSVLSWLYDGEIRKTVKLADVPMLVRQAVLAIEDSRFYEHKGVDYRGIARAARANFAAGEVSQGGSTLTQQYIKLVTNQKETTLDRKVQEAQYALELERRMSKDQIFENYLNIAYYGDGVYGIATAAEHFFSKSLKDLTLPEAASLAGTIARPDAYNPTRGKENVRRRNQVLDRMVEVHYATPAEAAAAKKTKLKLKLKHVPNRFGYYHSYISGQLQNDPRFDKVLGPVGSKQRKWMVFSGGLTIRTTLIPNHQRYAQSAVIDQLKSAIEKPKQRLQGALASVDPHTGAVLTVVGGRKFDPKRERGTSSVNFAVSGRGAEGASPGSAFKMFFMLAALEQGFSPLTTFNAPSSLHLVRKECPAEAGGWDVGNAEGGARGPINMYTATANSVNTWYAQLSQAIGPSAGVEMARRLGITTIPKRNAPRKKGQASYADWNVCSAVLGPRNVTPLDMASAYGVLANDGVRCEPYTISEIVGADGKVIYKHKPSCERVLSQRIARTAVDILQGGPAHGTGVRANFGRPLAGKTGTAQDYTSSFFAGFTPQISTAVWVGYPRPYIGNQPNSMLHEFQGGRVYGGTFAALIFHQYMAAAHRGLPVRGFAKPPAPIGFPLPNVVGQPVLQAIAQLRAAGLTVRFEPRDASPNGVVTQMSPGAGSRVGKGSIVLLTVGAPRDTAQQGGGQDGAGQGGHGRGGGGGGNN